VNARIDQPIEHDIHLECLGEYGNTIYILRCLEELWNIMFTSRDFLRVEYNVLSKNVNRDVSQSEKKFVSLFSIPVVCINS
jgi:hypothetical protein